jgi:simple sugar transport system ATP-binding protein
MKLELRGITKAFGPVIANQDISITVEPGQIHCLLGENGAGKSTLMNVLYGLYTADSGEILLDGKPMNFAGPGDAMAAGIGMVHQHFMLIPVFTVAENVALGNEPTGALDSATGVRVLEALAQVNRNMGATTLVITHNAAISEIADSVIRFADGRIANETVNTARKLPAEVTW